MKDNKISINVLYHGNIDYKNPSSVSAVVICAAKCLTKHGYDFAIYCDYQQPKSKNILPFEEQLCEGIRILRFNGIKYRRNKRLYNWAKIFWISKKSGNNEVLLNHIHVLPELVLTSRLFSKKIPNIFHVHSFPGSWQGKRWLFALKYADKIIAVSSFIKEKLIEKYPFVEHKVTVLFNGVDTELFNPQRKFDLKRKLGLAQNRFIVFFSGNIWKVKGFETVVKTAKELFHSERDIVFIIAGGFNPETNQLHRKWKEVSTPNMNFLGALNHGDLSRYYASANVTIVPSLWEEPFGMVIIESMSCGTPVIGSRIGGIPELIDDGINGFLINPGSVKELKEKIIWCKEHFKRLKEMGKKARKEALQFDWSIISDKLKTIYLSVSDKKVILATECNDKKV